MLRSRTAISLLCGFVLISPLGVMGQAQPGGDTIRVTVKLNDDGSRTTYEFDNANRKAVATAKSASGSLMSKIRYGLDDAGRFATGEVFGPDEKFRFKTIYKYDPSGRLLQETQLTKEDVVTNKIVYAYDTTGKQTGYAVYDGKGNLLGQTKPSGRSISTETPPAKRR